MQYLANISQFESLANVTSTVINNRIVVDNGFRDILLQKVQQTRQMASDMAKDAAFAGRKQYKKGKRALDTYATNKLLKKVQPTNPENLREWTNLFLTDPKASTTDLLENLPPNVLAKTTPIGRKNILAFLGSLEGARGKEALFNPKTFKGIYTDRGRWADYVGRCINFLANLNVDVSNILKTLDHTVFYSYTGPADKKTYSPEGSKRYRPSHVAEANRIRISPESSSRSLFHEFLHALHMNPYLAKAINKKGIVDAAIRKWAPYSLLKRFYDLYDDSDQVYLIDKRRAKRAGDEYAGKVYPAYEDSPSSKTKSWYTRENGNILQRKKGYTNGVGDTINTGLDDLVSPIGALKDLTNRTVEGSEYLSMLSNLLEKKKGRLNFSYAMDLLKRIKAAEKAQARQNALDNKF